MNILVDILYYLVPIVVIIFITLGYKMKQFTFKKYNINRLVTFIVFVIFYLMVTKRNDIEYLRYLKTVFVNYILISFLFNGNSTEIEMKTDKTEFKLRLFSDYSESNENNSTKEEG